MTKPQNLKRRNMFYRLLICIFLVCAFAETAMSCHINLFYYAGKEYATEFKTNIHDNTTFVFNGRVDPNIGITSFYYLKYPTQLQFKNNILAIGVDEYKNGKEPLRTCVKDARTISLFDSCYFYDTCTLTNNLALKENVRQKIEKIANELSERDNFFFYFSGYASNNQGLCLYDADYTVCEFLEDLAKFNEGINIIIMLDAISVDNFLNALPSDFKNKSNVMILAGSKTLPKKYEESMSPLTLAFKKSKEYLTDVNKDQFLSFYEMACRMKAFYAEKKIKNSIYLNNEFLAKSIYYYNTLFVEDYGEIEFSKDNSQFTVTISDIGTDVNNINIIINSNKYDADKLKIFPTKGTANINLKKVCNPTKFSLNFDTDFLPEYRFSLSMKNISIPFINKPKMNKNGKSGTYVIENYDFKQVGTLKYKKDGETYHCKLKIIGMNELSKIIAASSGSEDIDLVFRWYEFLNHRILSFEKKYIPGKSLSAKLVN